MLPLIETKSCKCDTCVSYCERNPGWCTPNQAQELINKGFGNKLMLDWWIAKENIFLLCPASIGYEEEYAPEGDLKGMLLGTFCKGRCTFLTDENLCQVHDFKPKECRMAHHSINKVDMSFREEIVKLWDTEKGKQIIEEWKNDHNR